MKPKSINDIKLGQTLMFSVASRSHTKKPYFVKVIEKGDDYFVTYMQGGHKVRIDENNISYHLPRITIVNYKGNNINEFIFIAIAIIVILFTFFGLLILANIN
jgi:hypothetical protein